MQLIFFYGNETYQNTLRHIGYDLCFALEHNEPRLLHYLNRLYPESMRTRL
jgi:hypothetical protein